MIILYGLIGIAGFTLIAAVLIVLWATWDMDAHGNPIEEDRE